MRTDDAYGVLEHLVDVRRVPSDEGNGVVSHEDIAGHASDEPQPEERYTEQLNV